MDIKKNSSAAAKTYRYRVDSENAIPGPQKHISST